MASIISAGTTSGTALNMAGDTSGQLQLATNGSTTAVTIDTSQNVGIGTASSVQKLTVWGAGTLPSEIPNTQLLVGRTDGFANAGIALVTNAANASSLTFGSTASPTLGRIEYDNTNNYMRFYTNSSERMRIDSSGNLLVGATTRTGISGLFGKLYVETSTSDAVQGLYNTGAIPYGLAIGYSTTPNVTGNEFIFCRDSTAVRFSVKSNGGINNYSANNTNLSDVREKINVELAGSYLDKICAIPVKTFLFNDQTDTDLNLGVIAQDVQTVAPELVSESNWGSEEEPKMRLSIYQTDLQYALMKCIQEQQTIINDLKARVTALEAK
jgi:hypothetical protein